MPGGQPGDARIPVGFPGVVAMGQGEVCADAKVVVEKRHGITDAPGALFSAPGRFCAASRPPGRLAQLVEGSGEYVSQ